MRRCFLEKPIWPHSKADLLEIEPLTLLDMGFRTTSFDATLLSSRDLEESAFSNYFIWLTNYMYQCRTGLPALGLLPGTNSRTHTICKKCCNFPRWPFLQTTKGCGVELDMDPYLGCSWVFAVAGGFAIGPSWYKSKWDEFIGNWNSWVCDITEKLVPVYKMAVNRKSIDWNWP